MNQPAIEVVVTYIAKHTIEDRSTEDGKKWAEAFATGAKVIPGVARATYGVSQKDPEIAMHFIDYETRHQYEAHKHNDFKGESIPPILADIMDKPRTLNVAITPCTTSRRVFYAPQTNVVFFWGIEQEKFAKVSPEFFSAIANSDACLGYIWGEVLPPVLADPQGKMKLGSGIGGVMISGWRSREEHDRDVAKPRVMEAYKAACTAVAESETWGMQLVVVEKSGWELKWERVAQVDRSNQVPPPGSHEGW